MKILKTLAFAFCTWTACSVMCWADVSSVLQTVCSNVDCLNNFTAKNGWSFIKKQDFTGGFTDLKQDWYLSAGPGFDVPMQSGVGLGTPFIDGNVIFKIGQLVSDKVPAIHTIVTNDPLIAGILGHMTVGESLAWDTNAQGSKWIDMSWLGATWRFGPTAAQYAAKRSGSANPSAASATPPVDPQNP